MARSDRDVLAAIADALRGTGRFHEVVTVTPEGLDEAVTRPGTLALVTAGDAMMEREQAYQRYLRTVTFHVVLKARARSDEEGYDLIDALGDEVIQALRFGQYTPYCLPERGGIARGRFDPTGRPNYVSGLTGTFAYMVTPSLPMDIAP